MLGGILAGVTVTGVLLAILMSNAGGLGTMQKNTLNLVIMVEKAVQHIKLQLLVIQLGTL